MPESELVSFIEKARREKVPDQKIISKLIEAGWQADKVKDAMSPSVLSEVPKPVDTSNTPIATHHSMWDAFEHILLFISLYTLALSIELAINAFIDKWTPGMTTPRDTGVYSYISDFTKTMMRIYISSIIVAYPLFSVLFLRINKRTLENPALRNLKLRKFFIYFTLIVTFLISLSSVIMLIFAFLGGDITLNFILHFVTVILINGGIFFYYLNQVKEDRRVHAG